MFGWIETKMIDFLYTMQRIEDEWRIPLCHAAIRGLSGRSSEKLVGACPNQL